MRRLSLAHYRNYVQLQLSLDAKRHVVLTGENGAGKTNLLEAVSLLSPGRGFKRADYADITYRDAQPEENFVINARLECSHYGEVSIGTGAFGVPAKRKVQINGAARAVDDLSEFCRVIWLTPAMDGLFTGSAGDRRRFFDRLILTIDPTHGSRVLNYEKAVRSRNRLLVERSADDRLFQALERQISALGTAIAAARREGCIMLQELIDLVSDQSPFPNADIRLDGDVERAVGDRAAIEVEERFQERLADERKYDMGAGRTLYGPHRTDIKINHRQKNMPASLSSTGEQKALLAGLILAHTRLVSEVAQITPLILLDEITAHLDEARRLALFTLLDELNVQAFMTGTDRQLFSALSTDQAQFLSVDKGNIAFQPE